MTTIRQPKVTVNKLPASLPAGLESQRILVVNQKLAAGTAIADALLEDVQKEDINTLFGTNSFMKNSLEAIYDVFERSGSTIVPQVDVIPLDDAGAGVAATSTVVMSEIGGSTNQATVAGTLTIIVGSKFDYSFDFDITVGMPIVSGVSTVAEAIRDAINANTSIPVTASAATDTLTLTCDHKGTVGNGITVKLDGLSLSGSDYVLGNVKMVLTGFASGATDPTVTSTLDVVGDRRYQTITHPLEYGIAFSVTNFLDDRFNVDNKIQDGVAIVKDTDTLSNQKTALDLLNSQSLIYICDEIVTDAIYDGSSIIDIDFVLSSRVSALRALRLTEDANISRIVTSSVESNDRTGGIHIASLPYFNTPLLNVSPIDADKGFTDTEIETQIIKGGVHGR